MTRLLKQNIDIKDNKVFYKPIIYFKIKEDFKDLYMRVTKGTRIEIVAEKIYGDDNLWWIIACANNLSLEEFALSDEKIIRVPHPDRIGDIIIELSNLQG